ncbi:uncharacterized protein LOC100837146 isoform X3 [Brachypodium distachyon]|uniref:uncharacterized protein LOC100837146 isoform X3 n=1 Tax=Brachypodium distachyon TaxID=15368 RepID=UPI000D0D4DED|nr:uncharacterized protein LOC100837146 isoform X3 [Brachypodium distachyon]|eukprot:XP_024311080.1 uncharacterized protein LOC100837146 isoform X3 [Brachypodium distachyon]
MRIRRYAARLLASSNPASAAASSPPPQPAAPWFHAAADDCAICERTRCSDSEGAPDGVKHKGHIARLTPEGELKSDERIGVPRSPPVPPEEIIPAHECKVDDERSASKHDATLEEVEIGASSVSSTPVPPEEIIPAHGCKIDDERSVGKHDAALEVEIGASGVSSPRVPPEEIIPTHECKIDDERSASKDGVALEFEMGASGASRAAARPDDMGKTMLVNEAVTEPADTGGAFIVNEDTDEQEVGGTTSPVNASVTEQEVTGGASLVSDSFSEPEVIRGVSFANEATTKQEVSEIVSLVSEAITEPAAIVTASEVIRGAPLDGKGDAEPDLKMRASLVNESACKMDVKRVSSLVFEAVTHAALPESVSLVSEVVTEPGVNGAAFHDNEVSVEPEVAGGPSLVDESTEQAVTGKTCAVKEVAAEPDVVGGASACRGDGNADLNEQQPPDYDPDISSVQGESAGEGVASEVQPSRDHEADTIRSVNTRNSEPVGDKSPTGEEVAPHDDTPSVSCVSDILARSVGKSGRTDIICYARRRGKRKLNIVEIKRKQIKMDDGAIYDQKAALDRIAPRLSKMPTAGSAEIKLADIKRELIDNSASSKGKQRKMRPFECDVEYCRMTFKNKAELSLHKKNMCTLKSCGRQFRAHKYLKRHQKIHDCDTPYKCPWEGCSMAFKWTWALAEHFQVHTGDKPYKCKTPGCGRIYKFVSDFTRHRMRCKPQRRGCCQQNAAALQDHAVDAIGSVDTTNSDPVKDKSLTEVRGN